MFGIKCVGRWIFKSWLVSSNHQRFWTFKAHQKFQLLISFHIFPQDEAKDGYTKCARHLAFCSSFIESLVKGVLSDFSSNIYIQVSTKKAVLCNFVSSLLANKPYVVNQFLSVQIEEFLATKLCIFGRKKWNVPLNRCFILKIQSPCSKECSFFPRRL